VTDRRGGEHRRPPTHARPLAVDYVWGAPADPHGGGGAVGALMRAWSLYETPICVCAPAPRLAHGHRAAPVAHVGSSVGDSATSPDVAAGRNWLASSGGTRRARARACCGMLGDRLPRCCVGTMRGHQALKDDC
jgi:hypothetical protein